MHSLKTQHVWIAVLEVDDFSSHSNALQVNLRDRLRTLVRTASEDAHLDHEAIAAKDEGHGLVLVFRSDVQPLHIAGGFIDRLNESLDESRLIYNSAAALRIRLALHHGMATDDGGTWTGDAIQVARDLAGTPDLHDVLRSTPGSQMAVIASEEFFSVVVRPGHRSLNPHAYTPVVVERGVSQRARAWIQVPGRPAPPGPPRKTLGPSTFHPARRRRKRLRGSLVALLLITAGLALPRLGLDPGVPQDYLDEAVEGFKGAIPSSPSDPDTKTKHPHPFRLELRPGREADLDADTPSVSFSIGLPGDGNDLGFLDGSLWAGVDTGITDVPSYGRGSAKVCRKAQNYARGRWSDVRKQGADPGDVREGQAFCLRTDLGNVALFTVRRLVAATGQDPGHIEIRGRIWK